MLWGVRADMYEFMHGSAVVRLQPTIRHLVDGKPIPLSVIQRRVLHAPRVIPPRMVRPPLLLPVLSNERHTHTSVHEAHVDDADPRSTSRLQVSYVTTHHTDYKVGGFRQPALDAGPREVAGAQQHRGDLWGSKPAHKAAVEEGL